MKTIKAMVLTGLMAVCPNAGQAVVYVNCNALGANDGTSWANAYTNLKVAVDSASEDSELWVSAGTYYPSATTNNRADSVVLKPGMKLYGGFTTAMTLRDQRNWTANPVVLSGDLNKKNDHKDNSDHILAGAANAVVDGFSIMNGGDVSQDTATDGSVTNAFGGGLSIADAGSAAMTVANCVFSANNVYWDDVDALGQTGLGGAVYATNSALAIINCVFDDNKAWRRGGAICVINPVSEPSCAVVVSNCLFRRNLTRMSSGEVGGGAIWAASGHLLVSGCRFIDNRAAINDLCYGDGAAILLAGDGDVSDNCRITDSQFIGNYNGSGRGGAVCANRDVCIERCLFTKNWTCTRARGGALYFATGVTGVVNGCVFTANTAHQNAHFYTWGMDGNYEQGQGGAIAAAGAVLGRNNLFAGNWSCAADSIPLLVNDPNDTNIPPAKIEVYGGRRGGGGAFWQEPGTGGSVLSNCTFSGNRSNKSGGAVFAENLTNGVILVNCIAWSNQAWRLAADEPETAAELYGANLLCSYCDVRNGWAAGTDIMDADPLFASGLNDAGFTGVWTSVGSYDTANGMTTFTNANAAWTPGEHAGRLLDPNTTAPVEIVCPTSWGGPAYTNLITGLKFLIYTNSAKAVTVYGDARSYTMWRVTKTISSVGNGYRIYDYHLKSNRGRWTPLRPLPENWIHDPFFVSSPCLDAGDPASDWALEPEENGDRINLGCYGNTAQASLSRRPNRTLLLLR